MAAGQAHAVLRHLRRLVAPPGLESLNDGQLLERFIATREEEAFAALVRRHGPLVLGVCRRLLRGSADAEDAFQATFLILFRRARSLDRRGSLAGWLYTVAYHVALRARTGAARRRQQERRAVEMPRTECPAEEVWRDLQPVLDDELSRLPEKYRAPVLLCYVEGKTNEEAGRLLQLPAGTIKSRLSRAREMLRRRLTRRGITLTGGLLAAVLACNAAAAVPPGLAAITLETTLLLASGEAAAASAPAVVLAEGVLKAMFATKMKIATVLLTAAGVLALGAGLLSRQALAQRAGAPPAQASAGDAGEKDQAPKPAPVPARPEEKKEVAVNGRVLDENGKPVAGAEVAVSLWEWLRFSSWEQEAVDGTEIVARTACDADGRFRLNVPQPLPAPRRSLRVFARAPGHALGWVNLHDGPRPFREPDASRAELEVRLQPEGQLAGKVIDIQGGPVAGVKIFVRRLVWHKGDTWSVLPLTEDAVTATTDKQGRFVFHDVGRDLGVHLEIDDTHCAPKELDTSTAKPEESGHLVIGVAPPTIIEGRVVGEDTGAPMANATLMVQTNTKSEGGYTTPVGVVSGRTDARGRFKISALPGSSGFVSVNPPEGQPYLGNSKSFDLPKGAVRQEVEVKLSRGVLLHGKVTEAPSGKPVARASVQNADSWAARALTAADGSYTLAVPPGRARLLVTAPTPDYIAQPVSRSELDLGKPGGDALYYHAATTLDVKKNEKPKEMSFTLRRGVTLKGTLVDPDGKPIKDAVMLVGNFRPPWEKALSPIEIHDSHWELRGCDPQRTYHVLFLATPDKPQLVLTAEGVGSNGRLLLPQLLGPKVKFGASLEVSPKNAGKEPLEVRLKPTGSARLHLVNAQGKPAPGLQPSLELVATPGPTFAAALETGVMAAETVYVAEPLAPAGKQPGNGDPPGTLTIHGLIPRATYRMRQYAQPKVLKDFTAEAGKTIDVDVPVE
jgi:RNA polymerase sigma factor (sigma-70 family)